MGRIIVLDCTLRDGGYINNWHFGKAAIDFILEKLDYSGIEMIEVGFLKKVDYNQDYTLFPSVESMNAILPPKDDRRAEYVGMIDVGDPIDIESIPPYQENGIDAIRVIFKQDRLEEGLQYIEKLMPLGYKILVQLVSTDTYSDEELISAIKRFNKLKPYAIYIVDTLGLLRKKELMRMVYLLDHNMDADILLGYHSHNNLQQARGNAEAIVECGLERGVMIDACVFGMGRGAGNLNEELFADYLNEFHCKSYKVEPMLEIVDQYLGDIYKNNFWGYSLHYYLSAKNRVHPNYSKYYHEKGTLTEKTFNELLKSILPEDSHVYSKQKADYYYYEFMKKLVDDTGAMKIFKSAISKKKVLVIAPGANYQIQSQNIDTFIEKNDPLIISIGFIPEKYDVNYIFCSNPRKYEKISGMNKRFILTSNIKPEKEDNVLIFNYTTYISKRVSQIDNAGLTLLNLLRASGVREINVAGMDGYNFNTPTNYFPDPRLSSDKEVQQFNQETCLEIQELRKDVAINFITDSKYD